PRALHPFATRRSSDLKAWAFDELMIGDDMAKAFLRLDAAFGTDGWEETLELIPDEEPDFEIDIPASERECLAPFEIAKLEQDEEAVVVDGGLAKRFVASYMARRCQ